MQRGWWRVLALGGVVLLVLGLPSCGHEQQLVSITVLPNHAELTGAGLELQFTALGKFIHPPETRDITSTVVWKSDADQIVTFETPSKPGLLTTTGFGCGTNLGITASVFRNPGNPPSGFAIVGQASVDVTCP